MTTLSSKAIEQLEDQATHGKPLCFILARKGSKRLKRKALCQINGKSLIQIAIDTAKESNVFQSIVVSSDDMTVLEIAYENKCVVHRRGHSLAGSTVQMKDVVRYLLGVYDTGEHGCLLSVCDPLLEPEDLVKSHDMLSDNNYVLSVVQGKHPVEYAIQTENGYIVPKRNTGTSQAYLPSYYPSGSFIWFKTEAFVKEFDFGFYGSKCLPYIIPHQSVDVDTEEDLEYARFLMEVR